MDFIKQLLLTEGHKFLKKVGKTTLIIMALVTIHLQYCYIHTDHVYATDHRILKN